jgi:hypothetical protein
MEATCSSEMSLDFQRTTQRFIPEDKTLHNHRCENLKSYNIKKPLSKYGCEIWSTIEKDTVVYSKRERNILKMCGPVTE